MKNPFRAVCALAAAAALFPFLSAAPALRAQTPDEEAIRELVARLDRGETEAVRGQLPEYVSKYQNHPGILFVQARVATDGIEAAKLYQGVLDNYPSSEWADDALFNLYQYYYAMGLYKTAELKMQQLRKEYPASEHLGARGATIRPDTADARPVPPPVSVPGGAAGIAADSATPPHSGPDAARRDTSRDGATPAPESPASAVNPFTLQVGAFSTAENAQKQKGWFEERGYAAEITNRVRGGRSLYLVWVGSFPSADAARATLREIQSRYNITPIVVER